MPTIPEERARLVRQVLRQVPPGQRDWCREVALAWEQHGLGTPEDVDEYLAFLLASAVHDLENCDDRPAPREHLLPGRAIAGRRVTPTTGARR
jgi:hypothetical protein